LPELERSSVRVDRDHRWMEDEVDFGRHLRILRRHGWLLVIGAVAGAGLGFLVTTTRPITYEAVTSLIAHLPAKPASGGVDRATLRAFLENQTVVTNVLRELKLDQAPHHLTTQRFVSGALRVEEVPGSNLFRVRVQLEDPALAAEASRRIARQAVALNKDVAGSAGAVLRNELKPHVDEASARLEKAEEALVSYQREAQMELLQADSDALVGERGELLKLMLDVETERARLESAEKQLKGRAPTLSAERNPKAEESLRQSTPSEPITPRRDAGVDPRSLDLSNSIVNPVYQTLELQIATSRSRLAALERYRQELARRVGGPALKELTNLYQRQVELTRRQNDYALAQEVFEEVSLEYEKARTDLLGNSAHLQVIDEAVQPDLPLPRKRLQTVALGLIIGLAAGALAAFLREASGSRRTA
jgi:uncharacterized protein involved in exopolysaccharide biosynthesis